MPTLGRTAAVTLAAGVITAGSLFVASSAMGDDKTPATPAPTAHHRSGMGMGMMFGGFDPEALSAQVGKLPEALRDDLAEILTTDDEAERAKLIEALKTKAEAGDYGDAIKNLLTRTEKFGQGISDRAETSWGDLPQALKDDLADLKDLSGEERKAALEKIVEKAKAGDYGDDVKDKADRLGRFGQGFGGRHGKSADPEESPGVGS